jgi:hypothetical protein
MVKLEAQKMASAKEQPKYAQEMVQNGQLDNDSRIN